MELLYDSSLVTAIATFSDGSIVETSIDVNVSIIAPSNGNGNVIRD